RARVNHRARLPVAVDQPRRSEPPFRAISTAQPRPCGRAGWTQHALLAVLLPLAVPGQARAPRSRMVRRHARRSGDRTATVAEPGPVRAHTSRAGDNRAL